MGLSSEIDNLTACIMVFSWGNRNTGLAALLADTVALLADALLADAAVVTVVAVGVAVGARGVASNGVVSDAGF